MTGILARDYERDTKNDLRLIAKAYGAMFLMSALTYSYLLYAEVSPSDTLHGFLSDYFNPLMILERSLPGISIIAFGSPFLVNRYGWLLNLTEKFFRAFPSPLIMGDKIYRARSTLYMWINIVKVVALFGVITSNGIYLDMVIATFHR
ncbi:hypothetical protein HB779_16180 [Phyllobacterium sp. 628]|uniref:hypothetical protein n=1 Tax=Phyllobacterium sp. 628 TaxID=2718938 RepID=UPI00166288DB|nr:hypothetical protein [Phyllobacterium sp. 628]QND53259.1 hypothetical protein HB779_16180 [Phyllobacterium sp. 628]